MSACICAHALDQVLELAGVPSILEVWGAKGHSTASAILASEHDWLRLACFICSFRSGSFGCNVGVLGAKGLEAALRLESLFL